jgi:hypothetical protein
MGHGRKNNRTPMEVAVCVIGSGAFVKHPNSHYAETRPTRPDVFSSVGYFTTLQLARLYEHSIDGSMQDEF